MNFMKHKIHKSNSHKVDDFDWNNYTLMVHMTINPSEGRPIVISLSTFLISGAIVENINVIHMHCSHVITCSNIKYDFLTLISNVYKVETTIKVYNEHSNIYQTNDIGLNMKVLGCAAILKCKKSKNIFKRVSILEHK